MEDTIKMDLKEVEWEGVEWFHLAQKRDQWWDLVNVEISLQAPLKLSSFDSATCNWSVSQSVGRLVRYGLGLWPVMIQI
jgi:hypothetical protein